MSQVYLDDREAASRAAVLRSYGLPSRPPSPRPPDREARMARLIAIGVNRRRLARIYEALARLEAELDDGRRRKHAFQGHTREERALDLTAEIWGELDALDIVGGR